MQPAETCYPAIILARAGSKGLPGKNLANFCGKPLLEWTLDFALKAERCSGVWLSTDSEEMAVLAREAGANVIHRPSELATDESTSEDGWIHALEVIEREGAHASAFVALQPTSPLRRGEDFDAAVRKFEDDNLDSIFSGSVFDDLTLWEVSEGEGLDAVNHDPARRVSRQEAPVPVVENGSLYMVRTDLLRQTGSRFPGRVGFLWNEPWQAFEIDSPASLILCEALMQKFALN